MTTDRDRKKAARQHELRRAKRASERMVFWMLAMTRAPGGQAEFIAYAKAKVLELDEKLPRL
jgi:hypothetical protein